MFYLNTIEQLFLLVEQLDQLGDCLHYSRLLAGIPILAVFQNLRWNSNKTSIFSKIIVFSPKLLIKIMQVLKCCMYQHILIWISLHPRALKCLFLIVQRTILTRQFNNTFIFCECVSLIRICKEFWNVSCINKI